MGDSERVMFNDAFSLIGVGGGTLGGGERWLFM